MKKLFLVWVLLPTASIAADSLESITITSPEILAKCYSMQPYALKQTAAANQATVHHIDEAAIQNGCSAKALEFAKSKKDDLKTLLAVAEEIRLGHRKEASLKVFKIAAAADKSKAVCDDSNLNAAVLAGLAHPADYPSRTDSDVKNALDVVDSCLVASQFKSDMQEELTLNKPYVAKNLCPFLKEKKVTNDCT